MIRTGAAPKFPIPWANGAGSSYVRNIPVASQIGIQAGAASLTDGFPPVTFIPEGSGGTPPFGQDANGINRQITQWLQWVQAGGPVLYDASFQAAVGGYPKSAVIASAATAGKVWMSTVDNNVTNPDTGGAGWEDISPDRAVGGVLSGTLPDPNFAVAAAMTVLSNLSSGPAPSQPNPISDLTFGPTLLAQDGYVTLPGGAVVQWGLLSISTGGARYINATLDFPIAFPSLCAAVVPACQTNLVNNPSAASNNLTAISYNFGTTGCSIRVDSNAGSSDNLPATIGVTWIAVGF